MKKCFAVIFSLALAVSGVTAVFANDAWKENAGTIDLTKMAVTGEGIEISEGEIKITKGGDFAVTGENEDSMIYISTDEKVKLRLSGMSLQNPDGPAIYFDNADKALITIENGTENYLKDGGTYSVDDADAVLFSNDDMEIKGGGKLTIDASFKHGIAGDDDVVIENGNIIITSKEHGIKVNDTLNITGGEISVVSKEGKGIKSDTEVIMEGGKLNLISETNEGIECEGTITVKSGEVNITASGKGINTAKSDAAEANYDIKIYGGKVNVNVGESGIDSNGNVLICGGEVYLQGPASGDKAPVEYKGTFDITGGKVFLNGKETADLKELTEIPAPSGVADEALEENSDRITVTLDGKELSFNTDPVIKNGTTLVGFRGILEALGATVTWDAEKRMAGAEKDGIKIELYIDSVTAYVNGEEKTLLTAPEIINGSTMIPVRFVSENLGMKVDWDNDARRVIIES